MLSLIFLSFLVSFSLHASDMEYKCFTELSYDSRITVNDEIIYRDLCYDSRSDHISKQKIACMYQLLSQTTYAQDDFYDGKTLVMQGPELIGLFCRDERADYKKIRQEHQRLACLTFMSNFVVDGQRKKLPAAFNFCKQDDLIGYKCRRELVDQFDFFSIDYPQPKQILQFNRNKAIDQFCLSYPRGYKKLLAGHKKFIRLFYQFGAEKVTPEKIIVEDKSTLTSAIESKVSRSIDSFEALVWGKLQSLGPYGKSCSSCD